ncbi:MAG: MBL fold metallo-hydrolase [Planctomycetota bacterium]|nr:MBL fold metallo-hydrolase [Planctomycetota bacterium]
MESSPAKPLQLYVIPVTPLAQNCSILHCQETNEAAVVDPGGDIDRIVAEMEKRGVQLTKILVTHAHIDHAGGVADLGERFDLPIEGPQAEDAFWIDQIEESGRMYGVPGRKFAPTRWLSDGDTVTVGSHELKVLHCPGHTPGHVVFVHEGLRFAIVGDVLFQGSIGRTDFPRGDHGQLISSIKDKLFPLGDDITFLSGHGPTSTFGQERKTNPFVGNKNAW